MPAFLPASLHRALLPLAHRVRHLWRRWRKTPIAGVSVIITNLGGDVLLLKHSYGREVREELGLELARIEPIGTLEEVLSGSPHTAFLFAGTCDRQPQPDGREVTEARYFPSHLLPEPLGRHTRARIAAWKARRVG